MELQVPVIGILRGVPYDFFGPAYIRELRGPFDQIPLVAVGGVRADNVADYFAAGARAVGVGDSLFGRQALAERSPEGIAVSVGRFLEKVPQ